MIEYHTYRMPGTFTHGAVTQYITDLRRVNDKDPIPAVPPEANLHNELYNFSRWFSGSLRFTGYSEKVLENAQ